MATTILIKGIISIFTYWLQFNILFILCDLDVVANSTTTITTTTSSSILGLNQINGKSSTKGYLNWSTNIYVCDETWKIGSQHLKPFSFCSDIDFDLSFLTTIRILMMQNEIFSISLSSTANSIGQACHITKREKTMKLSKLVNKATLKLE